MWDGDLGRNTEVTPEKLARLAKEAQGDLLKNYRELTKKEVPYDWSAEEEKRWCQFMADFLSPGTGEELATRWQKTIRANPKFTDLCVLAYMEQIRLRTPKFVDKEVLKKFYTEKPQGETWIPTWRMIRMVLVLATWDVANLAREDAYRQSLWDDLLKLLREKHLSFRHCRGYRTMSRMFPYFWAKLPKSERTDFLNAMLDKQNRPTILVIAKSAGMDQTMLRRCFLAKTVDVEFISTPFQDVLDFMSEVSPVTLWQDPAVAKWEKDFTIKLKGRWLDVFDQLLAETPFESALLEEDILWIGPPENRKWVEQRYRELLAVSHQDAKLRHRTLWDFMDTPFGDCLDYLADAHGFSIQTLGTMDRDIAINRKADGMPLFLELEMIAEKADTRWDVLGQSIVVASRKDFPLWEQAIADYRRQEVMVTRLKLAKNPLGEKLEARAELEFEGTPHINALDYLANAYHVPLAYAGEIWNEKYERISNHPLALGESLTLLLAERQLSWETDGQAVLVADRKSLAEFRRLMILRNEKHKRASDAVKRALAKQVSTGIGLVSAKPEKEQPAAFIELEKKKTPAERRAMLEGILNELASQTGIKIEISEAAGKNWAKQSAWLPVKDVPLESVLDLIAVAASADWQIGEEETIQIAPRPKAAGAK